jgi:hypothetical protein
MKLGGVIFTCLGILITVLVANGRWSSVWAAMLANSGTATASTTSSGGYVSSTDPNAAGNNP